MMITDIFLDLLILLSIPNRDNSSNKEAMELDRTNREKYNKMAREKINHDTPVESNTIVHLSISYLKKNLKFVIYKIIKCQNSEKFISCDVKFCNPA
jgi:hypothetical protein